MSGNKRENLDTMTTDYLMNADEGEMGEEIDQDIPLDSKGNSVEVKLMAIEETSEPHR